MTPKQKKDYIQNNGKYCPFCGSEHVVEGELCDTMIRVMSCLKCYEQWRESCMVSDIFEIDEEIFSK